MLTTTVIGILIGLAINPLLSRTETPGARAAIRAIFGRYASQAIHVAWCESRLNVWARNGHQLGLFQMGSWERSRYGNGMGAWAQTRAAHRYFVATGRDWSPWVCKP